MTFPRPSRNSLRADGVRLRVVWPGHVWRSWKERWFVLDGHLLKYYKGSGADGTSVDTTGELKGVIALQGCQVTTCEPKEADGKQCCFLLRRRR